jgi:Protein of unknown function (DUF3099)
MNITRPAAASPYAAPARTRPGRRVLDGWRPGIAVRVTGNDIDPNGPAGPQPSRADKRWYFALMTLCIGLFVLSWAVLDRFSTLAAVIVSAVALVIPPFAVIIANVASASDRRRP